MVAVNPSVKMKKKNEYLNKNTAIAAAKVVDPSAPVAANEAKAGQNKIKKKRFPISMDTLLAQFHVCDVFVKGLSAAATEVAAAAATSASVSIANHRLLYYSEI